MCSPSTTRRTRTRTGGEAVRGASRSRVKARKTTGIASSLCCACATRGERLTRGMLLPGADSCARVRQSLG
eukprot:3650243-Rhodomonas_salina.7